MIEKVMPEAIEPQAKELTNQANQIYQDLAQYQIATPQEYETGVEAIKKARAIKKAIDEKRKEMTKPLDEAKKRIMDFFRPAMDKLDKIIIKVNQEMSAYRRKQEEEARKREEELKKQAREDDIFVPEVTPDIPKTDIKVRKVWKFKVVDKSKIDAKFLIPDEKAINELVRKLKKKAEDVVGGIEVYYSETSY